MPALVSTLEGMNLLPMGFTPKENNLPPKREDPFSEERQNNLIVASPENAYISLKLSSFQGNAKRKKR